jgi:hypothetical protein
MIDERALLGILAKDKPSLVTEIVETLRHPPQIGSLKLSWRDGKLCNVETVKQTY